MTTISRLSVSMALAGTLAVPASMPGFAFAAPPASRPQSAQVGELVQTVQHRRGRHGVFRPHRRHPGVGVRRHGFRGHRYYGYRHHRGPSGAAVAAGIAAMIIGGAIANSQSRYGDRWERCDDRYRSFRWSDGTFQPYGGGPRQLCPYLRN
ncbi:MAG: BA14K family protein [Hyphomicrobiaceae bacterium]